MEYSFLGNGGGSYPQSITSRIMSKYKLTWLCDCVPGYIGPKCENEGIIYNYKHPIDIPNAYILINIRRVI